MRLGWETHGGRVEAVCRDSTTLVWSVACVCAQARQTWRHGLFLRCEAGYVWVSRGWTRGWGRLTMCSFRNNQDFRSSAHVHWSPTHGEARKPAHACRSRPMPPCCTDLIPYCPLDFALMTLFTFDVSESSSTTNFKYHFNFHNCSNRTIVN